MLVCLLASGAAAADLRVGPTGSFPDIPSALALANSGDRLLLEGPGWQGTYTLTEDLTVEPVAGHTVVLTSTDSDGFFTVDGADVTLRDLTVDGDGNRGLVVRGGGSLTLERVELTGGRRNDNAGGAVFVRDPGSALTLTDCDVHGNETTGSNANGGAIGTETATTVVVSNSHFWDNASVTGAGAIWCRGTCTISDSTFTGNRASSDGGALLFRDGAGSVVERSRFCGNTAGGEGGAIRLTSAGADLWSNVFWGNHAGDGGAISTSMPITVAQTDFLQNTTAGEGAAIYAVATVSALNTIVVDHTTPGGSVFWGDVAVDHVLAHGNTMPLLANGATQADGVQGSPLFAAYDPLSCEDSDLSLLAGSPALGAGDPKYGSDLGAFGQLCEDEVPADGLDQDCDGADVCYTDADGDGHGTDVLVAGTDLTCANAGEALVPGDCDDEAPDVNPDALEACNGVDDDCDGALDEDGDPIEWFLDADGDGHGDPATATLSCPQPAGHVLQGDDCDDDDPGVNPGAPEVCDGVDNDCDQVVDEDCGTPPGGAGVGSKWEDEAAPDGCSCASGGPSPGWQPLVPLFRR